MPEDATATAGNTLILTCVAFDTPELAWVRDGAVLMNDTRTLVSVEQLVVQEVMFVRATLEICSLEVADSGTYYCRASNDSGTANSSFQITVEPAGQRVCVSLCVCVCRCALCKTT